HVSVESEEQLIGHGLMLSLLVGPCCLTSSIRLTGHPRLGSLIREMLHGGDEGIGRGLAKPANRRVAHGLGKLVQQFRIPIVTLKQRYRLVTAHTAWRALAARFVLEEAKKVEHHRADVVAFGEDDDGMATNKRAVFVQGSKIERQICKAGGQNAARGTARQICLEGLSVLHAAGELDQLPPSDPGGGPPPARPLTATGHGPFEQAFGTINAVVGKPLGSPAQNLRHPMKRLYMVVERWPTEQPDLGDITRAVTGIAALAFNRFDHRRLFAANI